MVGLVPLEDQDLLPGPPVLRADDEIMDAPISVLHEEVRDVTVSPSLAWTW
jgi:hypothetical protein